MQDYGKIHRGNFLNTNRGNIRVAVVGILVLAGVVAELLWPLF